MYFRRRQARLVEFDKYNQILSNTIRSNFKYHSDDETRRSAAPCQVKISNVYDEELIEGKQVGEGPGCKNEVGEEGEVVGVLVLHDHRHAARLPADVAAISFGLVSEFQKLHAVVKKRIKVWEVWEWQRKLSNLS